MVTKQRLNELFNYYEGKLLRKVSVRGSNAGAEIGTLKPKGYLVAVVDGKQYRLHHLIWVYHHGYFVKELDHINRIRNDNRIENLRPCNHSQNLGNSRPRVREYKGVTFCKATNKWKAQITMNNKAKNLGRYEDIKDAARAYNYAAKLHFGEFAYLNNV